MYMQIEGYVYYVDYVHEGLEYKNHAGQKSVTSYPRLHLNIICSQSTQTHTRVQRLGQKILFGVLVI